MALDELEAGENPLPPKQAAASLSDDEAEPSGGIDYRRILKQSPSLLTYL